MLTYKIHLFRHGITRANLEGKYVGLSDYPLCQEGIDALKEFVKDKDYPPVEKIYTSPLRRCRETAHILYPGYKTFDVPQLIPGGMIMSMLALMGFPRHPMGEWECAAGAGYTIVMTPELWTRDKVFEVLSSIPMKPEDWEDHWSTKKYYEDGEEMFFE